MNTLYFLRHGVAVERGAAGYHDDAKRPLTPEGEKKVRQIAKTLRRVKVEFDVLLTSPFARALRTAQIVAQVFEAKKKLEVCDDLAVGGDAKAVIGYIQRRHKSAETAMLVGHEPYLSEFISVLLTGRTGLPLDLKKGGLCKLSLSRLRYGSGATLEWLLTPRILEGR
jgi:phosphohistidine phosphatase